MDQDLSHLITLQIPETKPVEHGFLDVVGYQYKENAISNCYAFFLNQEQSPVISSILISALERIIVQKYDRLGVQKELQLDAYTVIREHSTASKEGRIDIVVDTHPRVTTIIIEAKVNHCLNNDLNDYWATFSLPAINKAAIVLSLHPMHRSDIADERYINITHKEWLGEALKDGIPVGIPLRDYMYFTDFIQNINRITDTKEMTEDVKFYIQHAGAIDKAIKTKKAAEDFVLDQIRKVGSEFEFALHGNSLDFKNIWNEKEKWTVFYTMLPNQILEGKGLVTIFLEIDSVAVQVKDECLELMKKKFVNGTTCVLGIEGSAHYQHLLYTQFYLQLHEYDQLAVKSIEAINIYLKPAFEAVYDLLKKKGLHVHS